MKDWEIDLYHLNRGVIMKSNKNDDIKTEKEGKDMEAVLDERKGYRRLDMSKLKFSDQPISMEESLKDIIPIPWSDDVLNGKKKVVISKQK